VAKPELEFVNDWSELEAAVEYFKNVADAHERCDPHYCDEWEILPSIRAAVEYVPRLLTQYASLVEISFALTEGWEQYATLNPPSGLHLPDHR
jgi:hypothetical protein